MKIGLSTSLIEQSRNQGIMDGIGHYTLDIQKGLIDLGYDVEGYAFPHSRQQHPFEQSKALPHSYTEYLVRSYLRPRSKQNMTVDVFHATDFRVVPMTCPVVATLHDAIPFIHPEWHPKGIRSRLTPYLFKRSASFADGIIAVSEHAARDLMVYFGIDEQRIHVVPCVISEEWLTPVSPERIQAAQNKFGLKNDYFLSVGTLQPRKNFVRIIDAFQRLPAAVKQQTQLVIVGRNGWLYEETHQWIQAHPESVIHLTNVEDDRELQCLYHGAKGFLFPSLYEGFGRPVLEAFACDVPVIASNTTSLPEVCGDAAILLDPTDTGALTDAMSQLLTQNGLVQDLVRKGRERLELFREDKMLARLLSVYRSVC